MFWILLGSGVSLHLTVDIVYWIFDKLSMFCSSCTLYTKILISVENIEGKRQRLSDLSLHIICTAIESLTIYPFLSIRLCVVMMTNHLQHFLFAQMSVW